MNKQKKCSRLNFMKKNLIFAVCVCLCFAGCQINEESSVGVLLKSCNIRFAESLTNKLYVGVSTLGRNEEAVSDSTLWQKATAWSSMPMDSIWHIEKDSWYSIVFICQSNSDPFGVDYGSDEQKRFDDRISELSKEVQNYAEQKQYNIIPVFYYAGVKEGARIIADKELFGRKAGSNLADLITLDIPNSSKIAVTYPDFHICKDYNIEASPITFSDFFSKGRALSLSYEFYATFAQLPPEDYEDVTFTIEIPIECEYMQQIIFGEDYPESYYEEGLVERNENRVLRGTVTIKFDNLL